MSAALSPTRRAVVRETAEDYCRVLHRAGALRVAVCPAGLQWLLQRRREPKAGAPARWDAVGFCVTRAALLRLWRARGGPDAPALDALPERITLGGGRRAALAGSHHGGEGRA